jgi:DHA1 family tetracycline resistance protein-like MFS transporter
MGQIGAMFGIGFILGPVMGGLLGSIDVHLPFFAAGALAIVNGLYGYFVLPESLPPERRRPLAWRGAHPLAAMQTLARNPGIGWLAVAIALGTLAQFMLHSSWVLYTYFKFGWGPAEVGWSLFAVGAMTALVQGLLLKHLLKRLSPQRLAAWGMAMGALTYLAFGAVTEGWMMYVVIVVGTLLGGGAQAAMQSIVSNAADAQRQGEVMGAVASVNSLMAVFAPAAAGPLLVLISHRPAGDWLIGLPFYTCAAVQAVAALIAFRFFIARRHAAALPA